jgi:hypothetical protein
MGLVSFYLRPYETHPVRSPRATSTSAAGHYLAVDLVDAALHSRAVQHCAAVQAQNACSVVPS